MTKHQYLALLTLDIINRGHSTTRLLDIRSNLLDNLTLLSFRAGDMHYGSPTTARPNPWLFLSHLPDVHPSPHPFNVHQGMIFLFLFFFALYK